MCSGHKSHATSSTDTVVDSSKHIAQIIRRLEEHGMKFSFCLNKDELLLLSGFGLLCQGIDLNRKQNPMLDTRTLIYGVIQSLESAEAPGASDFQRIACAVTGIDQQLDQPQEAMVRRRSHEHVAASTKRVPATRKYLQFATRPSASGARSYQTPGTRPKSTKYIPHLETGRSSAASSVVSTPIVQYSRPPLTTQNTAPCQIGSLAVPNLDFLQLNRMAHQNGHLSPPSSGEHGSPYDAERLDEYNAAVPPPVPYDNVAPPSQVLSTCISNSPSSTSYAWPPNMWALPSGMINNLLPSQNMTSFSEEDTMSVDELSTGDATGEVGQDMLSIGDGHDALNGFGGYRP